MSLFINIRAKVKLVCWSTLFISSLTWACEKPCEHKQPPRMKKPNFASLDLNSDGVITYDEFVEHELPHGDHDTIFTHIDQNKDDQITEQELLNHRPPKRPRRKGEQGRNSQRGNERR